MRHQSAGFQRDVAALGELHRISDQVEQDLLQARAVAVQCSRRIRRHPVDEGEALAFGDRCHQRGDLVQQWAQGEVGIRQLQPAGLDPGQVEGVVDQPEQMLAGPADCVHVAALARIQRRALQQLAHAEHAGHWRPYFVAQGRQETRLRLRRLLGQCLLLFRQLPRMLALQALPVRPRQREQRQQQQGHEACLRPGGAPPGRRHHEHQLLFRRCVPGGILRAHPQRVVTWRQAGEDAFATGAQGDPIAFEALQPRPVAVRRRIVERQQAGTDPQFPVLAAEAERRVHRQFPPLAIATDRDAIEAQRRPCPRRVGSGGIHHHQAAVGGRCQQHAILAQQGTAIEVFLAAGAVLHANPSQVAASRFPAIQAATAGDPDPMAGIDEQRGSGHRRHAVARIHAIDQLPARVVTSILLQP